MTLSIDRQVAQLAAEGHKEIVVINLPSQAKSRKKRKPSSRKQGNSQAQAFPVDYNPAPKSLARQFLGDKAANAIRYAKQAKADRKAFIQGGAAA